MYIVKSLVIHYISEVLSMKTANEDRSSSAGQGRILVRWSKKRIDFFGGSAVCRLPFSLCFKKTPSYRKSEQSATAYGPVVSYCLYAVPFLLYRLFRRSLVSAAVSLPCTDVKVERFSG